MAFTAEELVQIKEQCQAALNAWWNPYNEQVIVETAIKRTLPDVIADIPTGQNVDVNALAKALAIEFAKRLRAND